MDDKNKIYVSHYFNWKFLPWVSSKYGGSKGLYIKWHILIIQGKGDISRYLFKIIRIFIAIKINNKGG